MLGVQPIARLDRDQIGLFLGCTLTTSRWDTPCHYVCELKAMYEAIQEPEIVDYGGRRRQFDRRLNQQRPTVPECRSGHSRRSGYDRRSIKNNALYKVKVERRADFERFRQMIPEEEKISEEKMILIDNTSDAE